MDRNAPLLFPCADRVKVPQLGSEETQFKLTSHTERLPKLTGSSLTHDDLPVPRSYLKQISNDITFCEDVLRERCFHMLPYDSKYFQEALDISDIVPAPKKTRFPTGRHNARGSDNRHMPCNLEKKVSPKMKLKPLKKLKFDKGADILREAKSEPSKPPECDKEDKAVLDQNEEVSSVFITQPHVEIKDEKSPLPSPKDYGEDHADKKKRDWDAYLMSIISKSTAHWIVYERLPPNEKKEDLKDLLNDWYGKPDHTELIRDNMSDTEFDLEKERKSAEEKKKQWKKAEASVLEKVYDIKQSEPVCNDPYSEDTKAPFYRQPAGIRMKMKHDAKESEVIINSTAKDIHVKHYVPNPPPSIRDYMNQNVGDKLYDTENLFQQEWLTGSKQVYEKYGDKDHILLDNHNKYKKKMQKQYPQQPKQWYPETEKEKKTQKIETKKMKSSERGMRRWKGLPDPHDDFEAFSIVAPGVEKTEQLQVDPKSKKAAKSNAALMQIVDEWRSKWHLTTQFADSNPDDLIKDMADIQPHVRLKAVATVGKAAEYRPPTEQGIHLEYGMQDLDPVKNLPEKIFVAVECLLKDNHDQVKKAAAITLYALNRPCDEAGEILRSALSGKNTVDRWAAAQCLAHFGACDSDIVGEVIKQLLHTEDAVKHEQAITLLETLSASTTLVHSLVAEHLNSSSWRHKVIACKVFPRLHGNINKDITNKLATLMWDDWHTEVRSAAAQALGKTGHGRDVHDDLRDRILNGNENVRLEAISKVGHLGIMTAKLLPAFLKCFEDEYVSVRKEVCVTAGNLKIEEVQVIDKLLHLSTFDSVWKVKAIAIQALGKIGVKNDEIKECLLWALRYEEKPGVRAEACHTLMKLDYKSEDVAEVLQDRMLVESSQVVRDEISEALKTYGISATEDMDMVAQIKNEVRKLSNKNVIATQITMNDAEESHKQNLERMIYEAKKEVERFFAVTNKFLNVVNKSELADQRISFKNSQYDSRLKKPKVACSKRSSVVKRVRTSSSKVHVRADSTSPVGRDESVFTPTADDELREILGREDTLASEATEAALETKSRISSSSHKADDEEGEERAETEVSDKPANTPPPEERNETSPKSSMPDSSSAKEDREVSSGRSIGAESSLKDTLDVLSTRTPGGRFSPSIVSLGFSESRTMMSRDADREKAKVQKEALTTYAIFEERYKGMVRSLTKIDDTFNSLCSSTDEISLSKCPSDTSSYENDKIVSININIEAPSAENIDFRDEGSVQKTENEDPENETQTAGDSVSDVSPDSMDANNSNLSSEALHETHIGSTPEDNTAETKSHFDKDSGDVTLDNENIGHSHSDNETESDSSHGEPPSDSEYVHATRISVLDDMPSQFVAHQKSNQMGYEPIAEESEEQSSTGSDEAND